LGNLPALVGLEHLLALADCHDLAAVVVLASPVVKEGREQVGERLGVRRAESFELRYAIVVLARPSTCDFIDWERGEGLGDMGWSIVRVQRVDRRSGRLTDR
jgi:hypothetical protein